MAGTEKQTFSKEELKKRLTPIQYHVTQEKGTERAFTGKYNKMKESGTYSCIVCGEDLFSSETKFDSGCGWPAFNNVLDQGKVKLTKDTSHANSFLFASVSSQLRSHPRSIQEVPAGGPAKILTSSSYEISFPLATFLTVEG
ncbi:methionine-R-sulfoxide reductase B1 isoform X2 [Anabrus simplex]|uniref:methionine-R-sulfoxide reductase B1 isoform X2 n=1 Tax=Anabrus simplex TaxID=316456 RepID=UPI0035A26C7F